MLARSTRRLPGFRFEVQAPPLTEVLSRMDVAIFVGFAASGPIEIPVAVESSAQFEAIFGDDAPLAWDTKRGQQVYAYLAPAVRAFFRNGGVRCWVIRVARRSENGLRHNLARTNYFPISGLARAEFDKDGNLTTIAPAFARARSEGSWSDSLRVATALQTRPLQVTQIVDLGTKPVIDFAVASPADISAGDLLQFRFKSEGYLLLFAVKEIDAEPRSSPPFLPPVSGRRTVRITGTKAIWCERVAIDESASLEAKISTYTFEPENLTAGNLASERERVPDFATVTNARLVTAELSENPSPSSNITENIEQELTFDLRELLFTEAPQPGAVMRVEFQNQSLLMTVKRVTMHREGQTKEMARVTGPAIAILPGAPATPPTRVSNVESLSFELWVRDGDKNAISLGDLAFESSHEKFWGLLPADEKVYREAEMGARPSPAIVWWRPAGDVLRFPLAGGPGANEIFFPFAMSALAEEYQRPVRLPGTTLERDGLASFEASLFLDEALLDTSVETFLSQAEFLRYVSAKPRALHGLHAAVGNEEATIIAVPDAVHRGWQQGTEETPPAPEFDRLRPHPDWWQFLDCKEKSEIKKAAEPEWGNFLSCGIKVIAAPTLEEASEPVNESGTFSLSWTFDDETVQFILEESTAANFSGAVEIYAGKDKHRTIYGRRPGDYFYRVRAVAGSNSSDWSNGKTVRVTATNRWLVTSEEDYDPGHLLSVQRALLRMAASRGDLFALLSLPEHYRETQALDHVATLKLTPERTRATEGVAALGFGEQAAFSYGAIYHPWLVGREENQFAELRRSPPCGAVCGTLAKRAIARGAWVAPANEVLNDVVTLYPPIPAEHRLDLQQAQLNLIRQEPNGFLSLSADTLSDDEDFRPINVRRLLILLRRMALRLGATYVFEPNSDAFRRLVHRGFNTMLDQMFVRGAFGGSTPATSYQVVTDASLNTPQSIDQGRFIVELRVAPSLPMTFLTVRLMQSGDRGLVTEGRL
ncbi:MAG TPA: phage tail sheath C-terminal domain-containing protein [Pyrinomonadaceae bacterium]|nr:phage tail sheath C-terminal domain-containing protein [Pyrinomonadaceae bacterium]